MNQETKPQSDEVKEQSTTQQTEPSSEANNVADLNSKKNQEIEDLKAQVEKHKNEWLYLRAEFENYKKNSIKERSDLSKYGAERVLVEVLNVIDNFDRALDLQVTAENYATYVQGVKMTAAELKNLLQRFNVTEVPSEGAVFDPMTHEALGAEETELVKEGHISKVYKKAYKLHDKLIRPAQVVVAKAPTKK